MKKLAKRQIAALMACVMLLCLCLAGCGHTHEFGEWGVTAAADCTTDGTEERVCECGELETRVIAATGHSFGEWTINGEADCTTDGAQERSCATCGEVETETIAAPGHSFTAATYFAPKTCTVCGKTEGEALGTVLAIGDTSEAEDHAFVLEDVYYAEKISEKHGNITYSFSGSGSYNLVLQLSFKNLATETLDNYGERFEEMELVYNDKYEYEGDYRILGDDIVPLAEGNLYILYAVPESMENDASGSVIASFELDGETYVVVVNEGDGTAQPEGGNAPAAGNTESELSVGAERSGEEYSFVLEEVSYTEKISEKYGSITYSYGGDGSYYLALKLNFTNLSTETLEYYNNERFDDIVLTYNDKYEYEGDIHVLGDDIVPLASGNVYILYPVAESMEADENGNIVAEFSLDGDDYTVVVNAGDGSSTAGSEGLAIDQTPELSVGDVRTGEDSSFVLEEVYFTDKISEKHGNITYSLGGNGAYYLVLKLDFTNLSTETLNDYNSDRFDDMEAVYDGKYEYEGRYGILADDIVPLNNGYVYVYYEVPESIENDGAALVASFSVDGGDYTVDCRAN